MAEPAHAYKVGYARVSTPDQKLDAPLDAPARVGGLIGAMTLRAP